MRHVLALALGLMLVGPAFAAQSHTINGVQWRELTAAETKMIPALTALRHKRQIPPARFDFFNPNVNVWTVPAEDLGATCHGRDANGAPPLACEIDPNPPRQPKCAIILPKGSPYQAILMRHEMGHCNGWPANHPD